MTSPGPLPPHLAQFVREQIAAGHFRSESDVIQTALSRMADPAPALNDQTEWLKREIDKGMSSRPGAPVTPAFWGELRRRVDAADPGRAD